MQTEVVFIGWSGIGKHADVGTCAEKLLTSTSDDNNLHALVHSQIKNGSIELLHHFITISIGRWIIKFYLSDSVVNIDLYQRPVIGCSCVPVCHYLISNSKGCSYCLLYTSPSPRAS